MKIHTTTDNVSSQSTTPKENPSPCCSTPPKIPKSSSKQASQMVHLVQLVLNQQAVAHQQLYQAVTERQRHLDAVAEQQTQLNVLLTERLTSCLSGMLPSEGGSRQSEGCPEATLNSTKCTKRQMYKSMCRPQDKYDPQLSSVEMETKNGSTHSGNMASPKCCRQGQQATHGTVGLPQHRANNTKQSTDKCAGNLQESSGEQATQGTLELPKHCVNLNKQSMDKGAVNLQDSSGHSPPKRRCSYLDPETRMHYPSDPVRLPARQKEADQEPSVIPQKSNSSSNPTQTLPDNCPPPQGNRVKCNTAAEKQEITLPITEQQPRKDSETLNPVQGRRYKSQCYWNTRFIKQRANQTDNHHFQTAGSKRLHAQSNQDTETCDSGSHPQKQDTSGRRNVRSETVTYSSTPSTPAGPKSAPCGNYRQEQHTRANQSKAHSATKDRIGSKEPQTAHMHFLGKGTPPQKPPY